MYKTASQSLVTLEEVQANLANSEQSNSCQYCSVVDVSSHSEGCSRHDVVRQHEVDYHKQGSFQEDGVFDEEEQELEAEDVVYDLGQHKGELFYCSFDGPIITEFAVVVSDLKPDLLYLCSWLVFVEGFEDADDVGSTIWTLNLFMIFLSIDLEDAISAEGVSAGHSNSEVFGFDEADAALLIIKLIGMCQLRLNHRCADNVDFFSEVRLDHALPQLAKHQPSDYSVDKHHKPTHFQQINTLSINIKKHFY